VPTGVKCAVCGEGELLERRSRRGKVFYSCSRYPDCTGVAWDRPLLEPCPACAAPFITEKVTKRLGTVRRCVREECGWQAQVDPDDPTKLTVLPPAKVAAKVVRRPRPPKPSPLTAVEVPTRAARAKAARRKKSATKPRTAANAKAAVKAKGARAVAAKKRGRAT